MKRNGYLIWNLLFIIYVTGIVHQLNNLELTSSFKFTSEIKLNITTVSVTDKLFSLINNNLPCLRFFVKFQDRIWCRYVKIIFSFTLRFIFIVSYWEYLSTLRIWKHNILKMFLAMTHKTLLHVKQRPLCFAFKTCLTQVTFHFN